MTTNSPLIALISAVPAAIPPVQEAFASEYSGATTWNILDDRLLQEASDQGGVTEELAGRMLRLIDHARTEGADGILLTCSMYGPVAHRVAEQATLPIYGPDDALFEAVRDSGFARVAVVSNAPGPLADSVERLREVVGDRPEIVGVVADGAAEAARSGDVDALTARIIDAVNASGDGFDAVVLAQYSLSPATAGAAEHLSLPVLAGPQYAVAELRRRIGDAR